MPAAADPIRSVIPHMEVYDGAFIQYVYLLPATGISTATKSIYELMQSVDRYLVLQFVDVPVTTVQIDRYRA